MDDLFSTDFFIKYGIVISNALVIVVMMLSKHFYGRAASQSGKCILVLLERPSQLTDHLLPTVLTLRQSYLLHVLCISSQHHTLYEKQLALLQQRFSLHSVQLIKPQDQEALNEEVEKVQGVLLMEDSQQEVCPSEGRKVFRVNRRYRVLRLFFPLEWLWSHFSTSPETFYYSCNGLRHQAPLFCRESFLNCLVRI